MQIYTRDVVHDIDMSMDSRHGLKRVVWRDIARRLNSWVVRAMERTEGHDGCIPEVEHWVLVCCC